MNNVKLAIIRGIPGSGKSTAAKKLAEQYGLEHFENDAYLYVDGKYVWTPRSAKWAAQQCFADTMKALRSGKSVVVSNVFVTKSAIDKYVNAAKAIGAQVAVFRATGNYQNIHDVPKQTFNNMKANFADYPGEIFLNTR